MPEVCEHIQALEKVDVGAHECKACVEMGSTWVHLRTCQTCGKTHCCDSSPNKHATAHFHESGHCVVASAEPGEHWLWCYTHEDFVEYR